MWTPIGLFVSREDRCFNCITVGCLDPCKCASILRAKNLYNLLVIHPVGQAQYHQGVAVCSGDEANSSQTFLHGLSLMRWELSSCQNLDTPCVVYAVMSHFPRSERHRVQVNYITPVAPFKHSLPVQSGPVKPGPQKPH